MPVSRRPLEWVSPLVIATALKDETDPLALVAGADDPDRHGGRWSYVAIEPYQVDVVERADDGALFDALRSDRWSNGPCVGLLSYDAGARVATGARAPIWPDLILARYRAWLAFDHAKQIVWACGWGEDEASAQQTSDHAAMWHKRRAHGYLPAPPSDQFTPEAPDQDYCDAVADVVRRIGEGELFQANIARAWSGTLRPQTEPFDVFARLAGRGAAYGACWRIGDHAVVSNSPELFLSFDQQQRRIEARPIKGTRPRYADPASDRSAAEDLLASEKDRAENLMIVDLMRNDLGRVAEVGSVRVDDLWGLESHPTVHHLTSVVVATTRPQVTWPDVLEATFPAGSITGAPKHQAMKVIAALEPPRGAWCGTLFASGLGEAGVTSASVLIRSAFFQRYGQGWQWRTLAGAGITADSDPQAELEETDAKIRALADALCLRTVGAAD